MFREVFFNKWILGSCALVIVFGIGCYFWYQHQFAPNRHDTAETTEVAHEQEAAQKTDTSMTAEKTITETSPEGVERSVPSETHANLTEQTQETKNTEGVPVSPHGFGPFPEVPDDYIIKPFSWDFYKNDPPIFELMERVQIKLWKQGIRTIGITGSAATGLVYPTIPGTVFVKRYNRDGVDHLEIRGSPRDDLETIRKSLMEGIVPDGIQVRDMSEAVIDAYEFLNIKK